MQNVPKNKSEYLPILVAIIVPTYTTRDVDSYASFINVITKKKNLYSVFFLQKFLLQ